MRNTKNLSYRQIGKRAGAGMSSSTAQAMIASDVLPPLHKLQLFLKGCRVRPEETRQWVNSWHHVAQLTRPAAPGADTSHQADERTAQDGHDHTPDETSSDQQRPNRGPDQTAPSSVLSGSGQPLQERPLDNPVVIRPQPTGISVTALVRSFPLRALAAFSILLGLLSGSAIAMWQAQVPIEVIFAVYGLTSISVCSWAVVARHHRPPHERPVGYTMGDPDVFTDPESMVAPPVIG
ncbi:hypothetical protein ACFXGA_18690 [Actinosynnema sp. NPDC059335]|uniref:hypothetical protein n=1 Tax=Actinosynnema sp. NPDC059335 TaxID=3346804 RepID=UPI00366FF34C